MPNIIWINHRYRILDKLGAGGSSKVYKAIDHGDPNAPVVAIKLLGQMAGVDQAVTKELFAREVRALSTLSHPRIVGMLDYGQDEATQLFYVVLQYLENAVTLRERLTTWGPTVQDSLDFVIGILEGVAYAHESHVIHRDLNPGNILIDKNGDAKIIDYGISKVLGTLTAGQTVAEFFTRPYASPEQLAYKDVSYATDIYSMAGILYFMLAGKDPSSDAPLAKQFAGLAEIPAEIREIGRRMGIEAATARYSSVHQAMQALKIVKRNLETTGQVLYILLTQTAIKNLYDQAMISSSQDIIAAQSLVQQALTPETTIHRDAAAREDVYDLIADSMSLRCVIAKDGASKEYTHFVITSILTRIPPHALEKLRQNGYAINAQWRTQKVGDPLPTNLPGLAGLIDVIDDFVRHNAIQQNKQQHRLDLIDSWKNLLFLDQDMRTNSLQRVAYVRWNAVENNMVLDAELEHEVNVDELFTTGQLLMMSSKRAKLQVPVGRYIKQEGIHLLISKFPDVRLDQIATAGKISVDERMWMASWKRQRRALFTVLDDRCANPRLPEVLLDPKHAERTSQVPLSKHFIEDLDESKSEVVEAALSAKDVFVIQGPPGTGKTVVICEIIAQILLRVPKARILLVSQSNVAVDHVLTKVGELLPEKRMIRIGREELTSQAAAEYLVDRQLSDWVERVTENSADYLRNNIVKSKETLELEFDAEFVRGLQLQLAEKQAEPGADMAKELSAGVELLKERIPQLAIEPTARSLNALAEEIQKRITANKSILELTLEEWLKRVQTTSEIESAYFQVCSVIAGTCVGIAGNRSIPEEFDWVIVDEAGRATPSEVLIPMVRAKHCILVGDHKQLPPVVEEDLKAEARKHKDIDPIWLGKSLFEYLFEQLKPELKATLHVQRRMHPNIANLISTVFYPAEKLESGMKAGQRAHGWVRWPASVVWDSTSQLADRFEGSAGKSHYNLCEVRVIESELALLEEDVASRKERKTVAIIAGYRAQVEQLDRQLEPRDASRWKALKIEINTVDAFQGREEDIVVYSVVRSNAKQEIGFLQDWRRLNVALSRARELLFIVGDHKMLFRAYTGNELNPFKDVLTHIIGHPAECILKEIDHASD